MTRPRIILLLILVVAAALRLVAAHNDLWLDELVSIRLAALCRNPGEVFTRFKMDNNHYLYTLYLYFLTDSPLSSIPYRLPSILAGTATVAIAFFIGRDRPPALRLLVATLVALNYPLIYFSSEARGYALAACAGFLAYAALDRWLDLPTRRNTLTCFAAIAVGLLSHLTFCFIWAALLAWSLVVILRRPDTRARYLRSWALLHASALAFFALFYIVSIHGMRISGGPLNNPATEVARFLAFTLGFPWPLSPAFWLVLLCFTIGLLLLALRGPADRLRWLLYLLVFLPPIAYILLARPTFIFSRYLMVTAPFFCEAFAMVVFHLASNRALRLSLTLLVILSLAGHVGLFLHFLPLARGHIADASRFMARQTPGDRIYLASAQAQRLDIEQPYAQRFLPPGKTFITQPAPGDNAVPDWYIHYSAGSDPPGIPLIRSQTGDFYRRRAYFPCSELSGQAWTLYHREAVSTAAPPSTSQP